MVFAFAPAPFVPGILRPGHSPTKAYRRAVKRYMGLTVNKLNIADIWKK